MGRGRESQCDIASRGRESQLSTNSTLRCMHTAPCQIPCMHLGCTAPTLVLHPSCTALPPRPTPHCTPALNATIPPPAQFYPSTALHTDSQTWAAVAAPLLPGYHTAACILSPVHPNPFQPSQIFWPTRIPCPTCTQIPGLATSSAPHPHLHCACSLA